MRPIYRQQEELWRTKKRNDVRTRFALVHRKKTASIAAHRARARAKRLSWIAIAAIRIVPETSNYFPASAQFTFDVLRLGWSVDSLLVDQAGAVFLSAPAPPLYFPSPNN